MNGTQTRDKSNICRSHQSVVEQKLGARKLNACLRTNEKFNFSNGGLETYVSEN